MKPTLIPELKVSSFKESLNFYINIAGFNIFYDRPEDDFAMLEINGARLMVEGLTEKTRNWDVGALEKPFGRGINFQIEVQDVQSLYDNFINIKYSIYLDIEEKWYRKGEVEVGNKQFIVQDPDGYLLRFFQDLGER